MAAVPLNPKLVQGRDRYHQIYHHGWSQFICCLVGVRVGAGYGQKRRSGGFRMCRLLDKKKICFLFYLVARWGRLDAEDICCDYKEFQNHAYTVVALPPSSHLRKSSPPRACSWQILTECTLEMLTYILRAKSNQQRHALTTKRPQPCSFNPRPDYLSRTRLRPDLRRLRTTWQRYQVTDWI